MFKKIAITIVAGLTAFSFYACDSLLDTEPRQSVSPEVALDNIAGVRGIVTSAYNRTLSYTAYMQRRIIAPEILADNAMLNPTVSASGRYQSESTNSVGSGVDGWGLYYALINDANYVIDGIDGTDTTQQERDRLKGEMLFLRALAYHDLVKTYGYEPGMEVNGWNAGVVLRTSPTRGLTDANCRERATNVQVYEQIEADLLEAIGLLSAAGGSDRHFVTRGAAEALLARVYLYWGRWADAADRAQTAMDNTGASLVNSESGIGSMFGASLNPESFFEARATDVDLSAPVNNAISAIYTPAQWFDVVPSEELLDLYDDEDWRLSGWYTDEWNGNPTQMHSTKFYQTQATFVDNTPVLRYGEMVITRAEALARNNQDGPALTELNRLREARGLETVSLSGQALLDEIMDERRRELGMEGHRWFDLKRLGMNVPKPESSGQSTLLADDFRILNIIPITQVSQCEGILLQNPGYAAED